MRYIELRRHTDNDGDALTLGGISAAETIGREGLHPPYAAFVSPERPAPADSRFSGTPPGRTTSRSSTCLHCAPRSRIAETGTGLPEKAPT